MEDTFTGHMFGLSSPKEAARCTMIVMLEGRNISAYCVLVDMETKTAYYRDGADGGIAKSDKVSIIPFFKTIVG